MFSKARLLRKLFNYRVQFGLLKLHMDLRAELDTVDHKILLLSLENKEGVSGTVPRWLRPDGRPNVVVSRNYEFERTPMMYGVPQ